MLIFSVEEEVQKYFPALKLSYQNKSCSECQQDVRNIERQTHRQADRQTDRQIERQNDFSAKLSKQKLFRMATGCQKAKKNQTNRQTERQTDSYRQAPCRQIE